MKLELQRLLERIRSGSEAAPWVVDELQRIAALPMTDDTKREEYARANPLGGPAKMFDAIADRLRAGEPFDEVMRDYGIVFADTKPSEPYCSCPPTQCHGEGINRCRWRLMGYTPPATDTKREPVRLYGDDPVCDECSGSGTIRGAQCWKCYGGGRSDRGPTKRESSEPVAWRIKTSGKAVIYEDQDPRDNYSQEWMDSCESITPLYSADTIARLEREKHLALQDAKDAHHRWNLACNDIARLEEERDAQRKRVADHFEADGDESMAHAALFSDDIIGTLLTYCDNMQALAVSAGADADRAVGRAAKLEGDLASATQPLAPEMSLLNANLIAANRRAEAAEGREAKLREALWEARDEVADNLNHALPMAGYPKPDREIAYLRELLARIDALLGGSHADR